ncbi:MAG: AtpZ/AtpI family protein [Planctomycetes bacterium]|nr:AtpZ/AtpI family protein [Planctomycetota bacterium]
MGTELAGAVVGGCILGWWVDREFGTGRWGLIVGASIGIIGGLYNLIRKAVRESVGVDTPPKGSPRPRQTDGEQRPPPPGADHK